MSFEQDFRCLSNLIRVSQNERNRRFGKTFNLCEFAKKVNASIVVNNKQFGKSIEREHRIKSRSIYEFDGPRMFGSDEKLLVDQDALLIFLSGFLGQIERRESFLKQTLKEIRSSTDEIHIKLFIDSQLQLLG